MQKQYNAYKGRIDRKNYALGFVINIFIGLALMLLLSNFFPWNLIAVLSWQLAFGSIPLSVRRFHDIGWSGIAALFLVIPGINFLTLLFLLFVKGNSGNNRFGEIGINNGFVARIFGISSVAS